MVQMYPFKYFFQITYQITRRRDIYNGRIFKWKKISSGISQRLLLGQLPSLIYIDDFRDNISLISGVFAEDISSFSEVLHHKVCFKDFKCDLDVVGLRKGQFNQDPRKQVTKVCFQRRKDLNKIISDKQLMSHNTPGSLNTVSKNKKKNGKVVKVVFHIFFCLYLKC